MELVHDALNALHGIGWSTEPRLKRANHFATHALARQLTDVHVRLQQLCLVRRHRASCRVQEPCSSMIG